MVTTLPRGFAGYTALLRGNPDVRNIWLAQLVSQFGDWFNNVALLGLINQLSLNPLAPALLTTAYTLPSAIASLSFGGYFADRFDRKKLAITVDVLRAGVALLLLFVRSADTLWIAYAVTILLALGESIFSPAISAAQPNLCKPHELATANALQQSTWASASMVGALLGAIVANTFGRDTAFVVNSLSFLVSAFFIQRVRNSFSALNSDGTPVRLGRVSISALTAGLRYLRQHPTLLSMSLSKSIWAFSFAAVGLYSVFAFRVYSNGDNGTSLLYAARGLGSALGPLLAQQWFSPSAKFKPTYKIMTLAFIPCVLGYGLWAASPWALLGALGIFIGHLGGGTLWTFSRVYVQRETPDQLRGRVLALDAVGFTIVVAVFSVIWGQIANLTSVNIGAAAAVTLTGALALTWVVLVGRLAARQPAPAS